MKTGTRRGHKLLAGVIGIGFALWGGSASAQVCCPAGCVQDATRCVRADATRASCPVVSCAKGPPSGRATTGGGSGYGSGRAPAGSSGSGRICQYAPGQERLPPGSFIKTCSSVNYQCTNSKDTLSALCKDKRGQLKKSKIQGPSTCADVVNRDGKLVCAKLRHYIPL